MTTPQTHQRTAMTARTGGFRTAEKSAPAPYAIVPDEVGVSLLGDRLIVAARIASAMHAQAVSTSARVHAGETR